eukprot:m.10497 g.10497  ORF g.10497 m.10497 type:complete len:424 (+) comp4270_c0_seq2:286-1557(+)
MAAPKPRGLKNLSQPSGPPRTSRHSLRTAVLEHVPLDESHLTESSTKLVLTWNEQTGDAIPMDIYTACSCGEYAYVRQLVEDGTATNQYNISGWTPLMYAAFLGHDNVVNYLLESASVEGDKRGKNDGRTALMWASACNHESIVYFLLQNGVNLEARDNEGRTSLFIAAMNGQENALKLLVDSRANIETRQKELNRTPLMMATVNKYEASVNILVNAGVDLTAKDDEGSTALDLAKKNPTSMMIINILEIATRKLTQDKQPSTLRSEAGLGSPAGRASASPRRKIQNPAIKDFLAVLGLQKYTPVLEKEEIDFEMLLDMNENDLKEAGIDRFGPRRKITSAVKCWVEENRQEMVDEEVEALVGELQNSFEDRVGEEVQFLTSQVEALSASLSQSRQREMSLEAELEAIRKGNAPKLRGATSLE